MTPNEVRALLGHMRDLALRGPLLSETERRQYRQQIADVRAADEAKRIPSPQLELRAA